VPSKGLIPYATFDSDGKDEITILFSSIEKYIQESDVRESALYMLEIQDVLQKLKININNKETNPRKRLF
jgi:hypothetical protein